MSEVFPKQEVSGARVRVIIPKREWRDSLDKHRIFDFA